ncbi:MAG: cytochrome B [Deltaproteobacteria bacterium]|nr:MAG: cytochrome B [Deltaproteobacteria bacterium]
MEWIASPYGLWVLFIIAFAESSFFPIPPDVFLIALCVSVPAKSFKYAAICTAGSVLGGGFGYGLGMWFMDSIGQDILNWYHLAEKYDRVQQLYGQYNAWATFAAGFTPLPYKLFTITAGAFKVDFSIFMLASLLARAGRFMLVAALIWKFGGAVKYYIDRYFNLLSIIFMVLLIGGFILIKFFL